MAIIITKSDGEREPFDRSKLLHSLERSGASGPIAEEILKEIEGELYSGITTNHIYRKAFAHLREHRRGVAARYSLKRAIADFGPSGFPFELYLAELFRTEGYQTKTDVLVRGGCVEHEVDVVLSKGRERTYVEAKFHNHPSFKTDLKTVLYVKARVDDLRAAMSQQVVRGMVVTNTKFTSVAHAYASCAGLDLLSWDYPVGADLHERIDMAKLYPVTALMSLSRGEKTALLSAKKVLCSQILHDPHALTAAGVRGRRVEETLEEVGALCAPGNSI